MKKVLLAAALMLSSVAIFAQHAVGTVTLQPKVGLNVANMTNAENSDPRLGLAAGAEFEYQVSDIFSLSAGALYSQQGVKGSFEGIKGTVKTDYVNVPILANVYVAPGFAVKLGLQPGFNLNHKIDIDANIAGVSAHGSADLEDVGLKTKTVDFAIPVGVSYEFNNFVLDARYNFGLTKVFDDDNSKHSVFQFTLGYKFAL